MRYLVIAVAWVICLSAAEGQNLVVPPGTEISAGNLFFPQAALGNNSPVDPTSEYIAVAKAFPQTTNINGSTLDIVVPNFGYLPISTFLQQSAPTNIAIQGSNYNSVASAFAAVDAALTAQKNQLATYEAALSSYQTQMARGFAATAALPSIMTPSAPGKTTVSVNAGFYRGETGLGFALAHRLQTAIPIVATASFAGSGSERIGRVGAAVEF